MEDSSTILKLILTFIPAILLVYSVFIMNVYRDDDRLIKYRVVLSGIMTLMLSSIVNYFIFEFTSVASIFGGVSGRFIGIMLVLVINEEFFKLFFSMVILIPAIKGRSSFEIFMLLAGIGIIFAAGEGITHNYFSLQVLLVRLGTLVPFHIMNGFLTAYLIQRYLNSEEKGGVVYLLMAWIIPALTHGIYKTVLSYSDGLMLYGLIFITLAGLFLCSLIIYRQYRLYLEMEFAHV